MTDVTNLPRSQRLKQATREVHDGLDRSIMDAGLFESLAGYVRFVAMQRRFHRDIDALYADPAMRALLPGLADRRRLPLIEADLADLGLGEAEADAPAFAAGQVDLATALGWLYVAEGSNMGAALLRKAAAKLGLSDTHGARHLAPAPEGPAAQWRSFTAALDAIPLDEAAEARAVEGAKAAFARVQRHADSVLA